VKPLPLAPSLVLAITALAASSCHRAPAVASAHPDARTREVLAHVLPPLTRDRTDSTTVRLVEVTYAPGGLSAPHSHPCAVVAYVLEGALRSQVQGEAERVYRAGESFYEAPGAGHLVSANASGETPARFLAYFVCARDATTGATR
jgi:quercetin dioxygenase-like cupin family protein